MVSRITAANGQQKYWKGYGAAKDEMPLTGYAALVGLYNVGFAAFLRWAIKKRRLPTRVGAGDIALLGLATHKLTRLIGKDFVTSPTRAPFVEYRGSSMEGEVSEKSRGHGLRRAIGDLVTCEICLAPWVAGGMYALYAVNPTTARFLAAMFGSVAVSDFLNRGYMAAASKSEAMASAKKEQLVGAGPGPSQGESRPQSP